MKTSNILLALFFVGALAIAVASSMQVASKVKLATVRTEMVEGNRANMTLIKLPMFKEVVVDGNKNLKIFIKRKNVREPRVWVENSLKDSVIVAVKDWLLHVATAVPETEAIVIIEIPEIRTLQVSNSNCRVDGFVGDTLDIRVNGNAYALVSNGKMGTINFDGSQNSKVRMSGNFNVEKWSILLSGNATLSGVSPNSKISMSVKDNAKIELSN